MKRYGSVISVAVITLGIAALTSTASVYCYETLSKDDFEHSVIAAFLAAYVSFMFLMWLGSDKMERLLKKGGWN
jgi:ABC-type sulfate transport system permease component